MECRCIDSHTHYYPTDLMHPNPIDWAKERAENYWVNLVGKRPDGKRSLQSFPSIEKFLSDMDTAGVERAIILGWYWENAHTCFEFNEILAKVISQYPDRLKAFASINPADFETSKTIIESAKKLGFIGIGELHCGIQKFSYLSESFIELVKIAARESLPISLHCTEKTSRNYLGKVDTDNDSAHLLAEKVPEAKFIFAHWGGGIIFEDGFTHPSNVYYDSAASSLLYSSDVWERAIKILPDNALYGSDYPLRLYPKKFLDAEMKTFKTEASANVPTDSAEKFFFKNANLLFNNIF